MIVFRRSLHTAYLAFSRFAFPDNHLKRILLAFVVTPRSNRKIELSGPKPTNRIYSWMYAVLISTHRLVPQISGNAGATSPIENRLI